MQSMRVKAICKMNGMTELAALRHVESEDVGNSPQTAAQLAIQV